MMDTSVYEVEAVLDSRLVRGTLQYLVAWKDFPREEWTWEPAKNVAGAKRAVELFHRDNPTNPRQSVIRQVDFLNPPNCKYLFNWKSGEFEEVSEDMAWIREALMT